MTVNRRVAPTWVSVRGRRDHHHQDAADGIGELDGYRDAGQLQRSQWLRHESVGRAPRSARRGPRDGVDDGRPVLGTGGSSSGVSTNVSFWAANVGTETSGPVLSPSPQNFLVGLKPTVGRISRWVSFPSRPIRTHLAR